VALAEYSASKYSILRRSHASYYLNYDSRGSNRLRDYSEASYSVSLYVHAPVFGTVYWEEVSSCKVGLEYL